MALNTGSDTPPLKAESAKAPDAGSGSGSGKKRSSLPLGVLTPASLFLVFVGERVLATFETVSMAFAAVGTLGVLACTALRYARISDTDPERRRVARVMAFLSTGVLLALIASFASTEAGKNLLGLAKAAPDLRARVEGGVTVGWIAVLVASALPLAFADAALGPMQNAERIEARRVFAAIRSGTTLGLAAIYCALFTFVATELDWKVDFSYFRTARPGESTRHIAASATEPIQVTAFFPELNDVGTEVQGYLRDLGSDAKNLKIETHDRLLVPAVAKEAKVTQDGVIVLTRGKSRESLNVGTDMKVAATKLKTLDADFQKSLLKVLRDAKTAYVTTGHAELTDTDTKSTEGRTGKHLRRLLESQNYVVKELGLSQGLGSEIPADATVVLVVGPTKPFLPEELDALTRYEAKGGHVLLSLDPEAKIDLDPLAALAGLSWSKVVLANDHVLLRRRFNPSDKTILVTNRFSSHASVSTLGRNSARAALVFPGASSLDKRAGSTDTIDFAVKSLGDTYGDANENFQFDKESEKRTAFNLAAAVTRPVSGEGKDKKEMRAFVVADADCFSDAALGNDPNLLFFLDVVRWLGGEESFSGAVTSTEDVRIEHTKQKDLLWFYGAILGAPAVVLGAGLMFSRRKRRPRRGGRGSSGPADGADRPAKKEAA